MGETLHLGHMHQEFQSTSCFSYCHFGRLFWLCKTTGFVMLTVACGNQGRNESNVDTDQNKTSSDIGAPIAIHPSKATLNSQSDAPSRNRVKTNPTGPIPPTKQWPHIEEGPESLTTSSRPRAVLMSAAWCQWCGVAKSELDGNQQARDRLAQYFELATVDVDRYPTWLDLPDFHGLPAFAFFDRAGKLLLMRSGYLPLDQLEQMFEAVAQRIAEASISPYPALGEGRTLSSVSISSEQAQSELDRIELKIYLRINSHNGGFNTPARFPYPELLDALEQWRRVGAPKRVESWIANTIESASRGSSPRLKRETLAGFPYDSATLKHLATVGAKAGAAWRKGIDHLPDADPYLGIQDPIDGGYFRYAAGPGWYQPHFERRALDNFSWAMLLRRRGKTRSAKRVERFLHKTFQDPNHGLFAAVQHANPFFFRLLKSERHGQATPHVDPLWKLDVQARAARLSSKHCPPLLRVSGERWPDESWGEQSTLEGSGRATPNAVGELLLALATCPGKLYVEHRQKVLDTVIKHWQTQPLPANARLFRLAAGICAVSVQYCGRALASTIDLEFDPDYPPPLLELAKLAGHSNEPSKVIH